MISMIKYLLVVSICVMAQSHALAKDSLKVPEKLVFSLIAGNEAQFEAAKKLKIAYANMGVDASFLSLPGKRALEYSNSGKTDGEVFRIKTIDQKFTNLVRIPTPIMTFRGLAYSMKKLAIDKWSDLKGLRIGVVRGVIWSAKGTRGLDAIQLDTNESLLRKLVSGGLDVIVSTSFSLDKVIEKHGDDVEIYKSDPLTSFDVYHFLHQKHEYLLEAVDDELRNLTYKDEVKFKGKRKTGIFLG